MIRYPTNFTLLQKDFKNIVLEIREGDGSGQVSSMTFQRKTILLIDYSKIYVRERIVNGKVIYYQYDWVDEHGHDILKFHSEKHKDPKYQTASEPFHMHPSSLIKLTNRDRLPNFFHRDLPSILEAIQIHIYAFKAKEESDVKQAKDKS